MDEIRNNCNKLGKMVAEAENNILRKKIIDNIEKDRDFHLWFKSFYWAYIKIGKKDFSQFLEPKEYIIEVVSRYEPVIHKKKMNLIDKLRYYLLDFRAWLLRK